MCCMMLYVCWLRLAPLAVEDTYLKSVWDALAQLEQLISGINDIMESLVDANLRLVSRVLLADLPEETESFSWVGEEGKVRTHATQPPLSSARMVLQWN